MKLAGLEKELKNGERAYHTQSREQADLKVKGRFEKSVWPKG